MTSANPVERPAPILTEDNHQFWEAAQERRLVAHRHAGRRRSAGG
jgi:hypothetical protein